MGIAATSEAASRTTRKAAPVTSRSAAAVFRGKLQRPARTRREVVARVRRSRQKYGFPPARAGFGSVALHGGRGRTDERGDVPTWRPALRRDVGDLGDSLPPDKGRGRRNEPVDGRPGPPGGSGAA